jgi:putative phage cell wall peptidase, NlpC/P60 family
VSSGGARIMPARIVRAARSWLGTPYHDQASVKGVGCDCLGLIRGVWREEIGPEPMPVPPYSRDWGEAGPQEVLAEAARVAMVEIAVTEARTGDVLLFRMRQGAIAKHAGILSSHTARGARPHFIHAYERTGVIEQELTDPWRRRIAFAFRFPAPDSRTT